MLTQEQFDAIYKMGFEDGMDGHPPEFRFLAEHGYEGRTAEEVEAWWMGRDNGEAFRRMEKRMEADAEAISKSYNEHFAREREQSQAQHEAEADLRRERTVANSGRETR